LQLVALSAVVAVVCESASVASSLDVEESCGSEGIAPVFSGGTVAREVEAAVGVVPAASREMAD
jgi:hypothetical protein